MFKASFFPTTSLRFSNEVLLITLLQDDANDPTFCLHERFHESLPLLVVCCGSYFNCFQSTVTLKSPSLEMFLFCTDTQIGKLFVTRLCDPEMLFEREQKLVKFSDSFLFL